MPLVYDVSCDVRVARGFRELVADRLTFSFVVISGLWLELRLVAYVLQQFDTKRHHVESAAFIFCFVLLTRAFVAQYPWTTAINGGGSSRGELTLSQRIHQAFRSPPVYIVGALLLYWPILGIGLLSDDYVLADRASDLAIFGGLDFFRPLPLFIWALLKRLLPDPGVYAVALHLLNVTLHGVNAWLVFRNLETHGLSRYAAPLAGTMFLVFPLSAEPVVWASAIFDVLLTTLVLSALLVMRSKLSFGRLVFALILITVAAISTKETAVATPVLLAIGFAATGPFSRAEAKLLLAVGLIVIVYTLIRIGVSLNTAVFPPLTGYTFKELFSRPFAALAMPIHANVVSEYRLLTLAVVAVPPALLIASAQGWFRDRTTAWAVVLWGGWVLASVAPVFTVMFIDANLQNARYLYLPSAAWAWLVAGCLHTLVTRGWVRSALAIGVSLCVTFALIQREHLRAWQIAAETRNSILHTVRSRPAHCGVIAATGLPDNIAGAFVFRNGFAQAVANEGALVVQDGAPVPRECVLRLELTRRIPQ